VYTADMRPLNAAVLIAVLTTTQCKTAEGQRAESASATCAADTVACLARILERHGGLEHFRRPHDAQYTATDDYSFPFTLLKPWPNKAAAWTKKADRANADQVMMFPVPTSCLTWLRPEAGHRSRAMRTTLESLGASPNFSYRYLCEWPIESARLSEHPTGIKGKPSPGEKNSLTRTRVSAFEN